ncbi:MAG: DUF2490 domain-containing protein [Flavobacteriales bacterium]|nr:DUF2490 domain-containing protein [Flavobacteriales bacterium]
MIKNSFIVILMVLLSSPFWSQNKDFQIWAGMDVKHNFSKKLSVSLKEEVRTAYNSQLVKKVFTQVNITYRVIKPIKISLGYRHNFLFNAEDRAPVKRIYSDLVYSKKIKKFKPSVRFRYQRQWNYESVDNTLRLKLKTTINLPGTPINSFFSGEVFNTIYKGFDKCRFTVGLDRKITKKLSGKIYYRYQWERNTSSVEKLNVMGIRLSLEI